MPPSPAMAPIQSDSLAMNFEFDIRPREVRPSIRCFVFGQLILRKMCEIDATGCQILSLKCTKFLRHRPRWGSLQRSPDPLAVF